MLLPASDVVTSVILWPCVCVVLVWVSYCAGTLARLRKDASGDTRIVLTVFVSRVGLNTLNTEGEKRN